MALKENGLAVEGEAGYAALVGSAYPVHSEFEAQAQLLSARYGVSLTHARLIVRLLRGGAA